jgi:Spy/CpxP family protein refolding chaperone
MIPASPFRPTRLGVVLGLACAVLVPTVLSAQPSGRLTPRVAPFRPGVAGQVTAGPLQQRQPLRARQAGLLDQFRNLNLTQAQRDQMKGIVDRHRADMQAATRRVAETRRAMNQALAAEPLDEAAVRARGAEVGAATADAAILRARVRLELLQVLTAEQREQLRVRRERVQQRFQQRLQQMQQRLQRRRIR